MFFSLSELGHQRPSQGLFSAQIESTPDILKRASPSLASSLSPWDFMRLLSGSL